MHFLGTIGSCKISISFDPFSRWVLYFNLGLENGITLVQKLEYVQFYIYKELGK